MENEAGGWSGEVEGDLAVWEEAPHTGRDDATLRRERGSTQGAEGSPAYGCWDGGCKDPAGSKPGD